MEEEVEEEDVVVEKKREKREKKTVDDLLTRIRRHGIQRIFAIRHVIERV